MVSLNHTFPGAALPVAVMCMSVATTLLVKRIHIQNVFAFCFMFQHANRLSTVINAEQEKGLNVLL